MTEMEILRFAVKSSPELWRAVQITQKVQELGIAFPIESEAQLLTAFGSAPGAQVSCGDVSFSADQLRKFFPLEFYPIHRADDLLGKMLAALHFGRQVHHVEQQLLQQKRFFQKKAESK